MTIGNQIKKQRLASNLSQSDVQFKMGYKSINTIKKWENDSLIPTIESLCKMHKLFGWTFTHKIFKNN